MELLGETDISGKITDSKLEEVLSKHGTVQKDVDGKITGIITKPKGYEIAINDIWNGSITQVKVTKNGANVPYIDGFESSTTSYITWASNISEPIATLMSTKTEEEMGNWYDYKAGVNKWANVKTSGGTNDCYWVWIPRYAYKIPSKNSAQTIQVAFLNGKGASTKDIIDPTLRATIEQEDGFKTNTQTYTVEEGDWVIHPAFTNDGNGGLGDLTGIWVAKFEASSDTVKTINVMDGTGDMASLSTSGGGAYTNQQITVRPNVTSWRGLNVNDMFTACRDMTSSTNTSSSLSGSTALDSHLMKNTEWGAVAYLSMSQYGKNSIVYNNPYYKADQSTITGLAGSNPTQTNNGTTTDLHIYNTTGGINASTTGNVYGIYDMAGRSLGIRICDIDRRGFKL